MEGGPVQTGVVSAESSGGKEWPRKTGQRTSPTAPG